VQEISAVIQSITDDLVAALDAGAPLTAPALRFLARRLRDTAADSIASALGLPLAAILSSRLEDEPLEARARWLTALADAALLSSDARIRDVGGRLAAGLQAACTGERRVRAASVAIAALIEAGEVAGVPSVLAAVDALERVVGAAYRPGDGMSAMLDEPRDCAGAAGDQTASAAALLAAHAATGRLPYAMLADELMQVAFRRTWDDETTATAVHVCCGLARLHRVHDFRASAVISDLDYEAKADDLIAAMSAESDAATYGLALAERLDLK